MSSTTSSIWNHPSSAGQMLKGPASLDSTGGSNDSSASNSSTISANDFLTLLVTEMQNQDPTASTDPNEYINQLVQVNSLEQLISINQTLTADSGGSAPTTQRTARAAGDTSVADGLAAKPTEATQKSAASSRPEVAPASHILPLTPVQHAPGNLSIPQANPAAQRVANALSGLSRP